MIKRVLLSLVCVGISAIFIRAGTFPLSHTEAPNQVLWFGVACIAYGGASILLLLLAWKSAILNVDRYQKYISVVFIALFLVASFDVGMVSGLEMGSLLIAGLFAYVNWYSIKSVQAT